VIALTRGWPLLLLLLAALALPVGGCNEQTAAYPQRQVPSGLMDDAAQLRLGQQLFMGKCASCHGKPSEGRSDRATFFQPPATDFSSRHYREVDPAYLYWRIEVGKQAEPYRSRGSVMPAWGAHFSEQQIWQLVAYLKKRAE
jgi:mono/diheme cytochrome c family protein